MYFISPPNILKFYYKDLIWDVPDSGKKIYLTFDDGPEESTTLPILEILDRYHVKATFFCLGNKAEKSPEIIRQLKKSGHIVGNHCYNHIRGRSTNVREFLDNVVKGNDLLHTNLFRPPYGSITKKQIRGLRAQFRIVMWSVLPGDFDESVSKEKCLRRSIRYTKSGSIIVFHDNLKSKEKVLYVLPKYLQHFIKLGYTFDALSENLFQ